MIRLIEVDYPFHSRVLECSALFFKHECYFQEHTNALKYEMHFFLSFVWDGCSKSVYLVVHFWLDRFSVPLQIAIANKTVVPSMVAKKFPPLEVERSDGSRLKIPILYDSGSEYVKASLLCLSFRASSQV